jgi:biotin carboxyl carrier protein
MGSQWQHKGRSFTVEVEVEVRSAPEGKGACTVTVNDDTFEFLSVSFNDGWITLEEKIAGQETTKLHRLPIERSRGHVSTMIEGHSLELAPAEEEQQAGDGRSFSAEITSPMPGKVLEILVAVGDEVAADQGLITLEAMKMEQVLRASAAARVIAVNVEADAMVGPGDLLIKLEALPDS